MERKLKRPCWFQIKIALAIYEKKDVIGIAATSTPLNILGKQTILDLGAADVNAIAVSKENANEQTFQVQQQSFIKSEEYQI
jgi:hypothetical protein